MSNDETESSHGRISSNNNSRRDLEMERILQSHGFALFGEIVDYGFFSWTPRGPYRQLHQVTADEMRASVHVGALPPQMRPLAELQAECPITLKPITTQAGKNKKNNQKNNHNSTTNTRNEYPYNSSFLVPLYVATVHYHIRPADIDFLFGGSLLYTLATGKIENNQTEYWAQQVPGTGWSSLKNMHLIRNIPMIQDICWSSL